MVGDSGVGQDYVAWKGWKSPFRISSKQRRYFEGEVGAASVAGKKVLELGFGEGGFLAWCREHGADVYGIEILGELVDAGREHGLSTFRSADFPWADHAASFDLVVGLDVLEHLDLQQLEELLDRVEGVTRPGGRNIFRFPNGQSPFGPVFQHGDVTHKSVLSGPILGQLCQGRTLRLARVKKPYYPILDRPLLRNPFRPLRRLVDFCLESMLLWGVARGLGIRKYVLSPIVVVVLERHRESSREDA